MSQTAIVIGATGLTGSSLVTALLDDPAFSVVKTVGRKPLTLTHPRLQQMTLSLTDIPALQGALLGDVMFCCIGTTIKKAGSKKAFTEVDLDIPVRCAEIAYRNGVKQFLLISAIGANAASPNFYLRTKGQTEQGIARTGFEGVHIFRPSIILGERQEFRLGEKIGGAIMQGLRFLLQGKLKKYRGISAEVIAAAMQKIARQKVKGTHIYESDEIQAIADNTPAT
ncbi:NAD(P)H-binding protein [Chitinophaga horti]|uniref:NAD(P)H-binding protein n=1 Tax=Chitinophaga horti TaxID=2920382 RepID=A0ABY6IW68_9BACT|nr:NAD(P)H-binding protein [Chitinophaga horti]UYQ91620.1 NAD(P)H-binding protein [Chitinophaga horti]